MRTAEEIVDTYYKPKMHWKLVNRKEIINAINEARIEAIRECAEVAITKTESFYGRDDRLHDRQIVDEKSILSLIEQIK